jgi:hypothetical protein
MTRKCFYCDGSQADICCTDGLGNMICNDCYSEYEDEGQPDGYFLDKPLLDVYTLHWRRHPQRLGHHQKFDVQLLGYNVQKSQYNEETNEMTDKQSTLSTLLLYRRSDGELWVEAVWSDEDERQHTMGGGLGRGEASVGMYQKIMASVIFESRPGQVITIDPSLFDVGIIVQMRRRKMELSQRTLPGVECWECLDMKICKNCKGSGTTTERRPPLWEVLVFVCEKCLGIGICLPCATADEIDEKSSDSKVIYR